MGTRFGDEVWGAKYITERTRTVLDDFLGLYAVPAMLVTSNWGSWKRGKWAISS
jgi:hypothetical protein